MAEVIYISEDMTVAWTGLSYTTSAGVVTYLNAATVTYALKTATGTTVASGTGTLSYVSASSGNYTGSIESTVTSALTEGSKYFLEVTAAESPYNGFRRIEHRAEYRGTD